MDTSVLIDFRTKSVDQHADMVSVSVMSVAELQYGVTAAEDPVQQMRRRRRIHQVLDWFDVLPFDLAATEY